MHNGNIVQVEVCQLEDDFAKLAQGENTLIGERGVNLSGGKYAKISIHIPINNHKYQEMYRFM